MKYTLWTKFHEENCCIFYLLKVFFCNIQEVCSKSSKPHPETRAIAEHLCRGYKLAVLIKLEKLISDFSSFKRYDSASTIKMFSYTLFFWVRLRTFWTSFVSLSLSLSLSLYIYIYIHMCVCVCVCVGLHMHVQTYPICIGVSNICMDLSLSFSLSLFLSLSLYIYIYIWECISMCVCMYVCMYMYIIIIIIIAFSIENAVPQWHAVFPKWYICIKPKVLRHKT